MRLHVASYVGGAGRADRGRGGRGGGIYPGGRPARKWAAAGADCGPVRYCSRGAIQPWAVRPLWAVWAPPGRLARPGFGAGRLLLPLPGRPADAAGHAGAPAGRARRLWLVAARLAPAFWHW